VYTSPFLTYISQMNQWHWNATNSNLRIQSTIWQIWQYHHARRGSHCWNGYAWGSQTHQNIQKNFTVRIGYRVEHMITFKNLKIREPCACSAIKSWNRPAVYLYTVTFSLDFTMVQQQPCYNQIVLLTSSVYYFFC